MLLCTASQGQPDAQPDTRPDAQIARDAVARGAFLPMERILTIVSRDHPGELVEIELEQEDGVWEYEVEIVTPQGRLIEVRLQAATGRILRVEDKDDTD
ncbi:PepSY domain-containing protein [Paracoccus spongiarum]|uniref:PepSY domain-containing protein n=1 Tax=Paracoccus spongiarum TaxID=3064387 RepID=A0ABT9J7J1_9RHOB|nr:PepSY domain-containing protein [Paracoccus sp. 2205BS29-5]MDP5305756.1 PepSY domain-containing protein [Paracoccus sp. 2205BS29-5]